jgi:hypothetical protein
MNETPIFPLEIHRHGEHSIEYLFADKKAAQSFIDVFEEPLNLDECIYWDVNGGFLVRTKDFEDVE